MKDVIDWPEKQISVISRCFVEIIRCGALTFVISFFRLRASRRRISFDVRETSSPVGIRVNNRKCCSSREQRRTDRKQTLHRCFVAHIDTHCPSFSSLSQERKRTRLSLSLSRFKCFSTDGNEKDNQEKTFDHQEKCLKQFDADFARKHR